MEHPPSNTKRVKLMITYGGKFKPRLTNLHDHPCCYSYIGGDNKIITVDRNIKFSDLVAKLSTSFMFSDVCFKYQLLGEDLDALIPVYNEEDLNHMMFDYDRICCFSPKLARLRVFLFPASINNNKAFEDSVHVSPFEDSSPTTTPPTPPSKMIHVEFPKTSSDLATKDTVTKAEMKKFCRLHVVNDEFEDILKLYLKRSYSKVKEFHGLHVINDEFEDILNSFWKSCFLKPNVVL